jgi:iron complex outermembrane receptor protein
LIAGLTLGSTFARGDDLAPGSASAAGAEGLQEIVVTAQRRSENAERTPLTVTALSQDALQIKGVTSESDLQSSVPGLTVRTTSNSNQLNFAIRGQSVDTFSASPSAVLQYFDEIQITPYSATPFFDLQSVQVLKGPQGTLFGRNGTGGAVLFTSAAPTNELGGYATVRFGDYSSRYAEGALNVPLVDDRLLLRVAGTYQYHDGYTYNIWDNRRVGTVQRGGLRGSLFAKISDSLTNTTVIDYNSSGGSDVPNVAYSAYAPGSTNRGIPLASTGALLFSPALDAVTGPGSWAAYLAAHPKVFAGGLVAYTALQNSRGPYVADVDSSLTHQAHGITVSNVTRWDIAPDLTLKNILGYSYSYAFDVQEYDGTPYQIEGEGEPGANPAGGWFSTRSYSEELQLQGSALDSQLQYTTGLYYSNDGSSQGNTVYFFDVSPLIPVTIENLPSKSFNKSYAVYGQGTYDLSRATGIEGLSLTGGLRFTKVDYEQVAVPGAPNYGEPGFPNILSSDAKKASWQIGAQQQINAETMVYVTSRHSFRSGGFNPQSPARPGTSAEGGAAFNPETTTDVELGAKFQGAIAGVPVRLNAALYEQWVNDVQRTIYATVPNFGLAALTVNIPQARIRGVESDFEIRPANWLSVGGNVAYTDGRYTKNQVNVFGDIQNYGPFSDTPRWAGSAFTQVNLPTPKTIGELSVRADLYSQSMFYFSSTADTISPFTDIRGYTLTNFRVALDNVGGSSLSLAASLRNAFDRVYYTGGLATGVITSINSVSPGAPRTFYVEARYKF